jgi:hypothetical protein
MNNQEAKLILQAYRLGGQDAADPQFQEALDQLERDPALAEWFALERAIEIRVQARIRNAVRPPAHLKAHLLAQGRIVRPAAWWRQPVWLAAAASVVLLGVLATTWFKQPSGSEFAVFRRAMVQSALQVSDHVSFETHNLTKIQQWLKDRDLDTNFDLPSALRGNSAEGCRVVDWRRQKVTLICYVFNGSDHLDLFVLDSTRFGGFTPPQTPVFARTEGLMTASWTRGNKTYLLATSGGEAVLRKYL